jgi:hypothetical protein
MQLNSASDDASAFEVGPHVASDLLGTERAMVVMLNETESLDEVRRSVRRLFVGMLIARHADVPELLGYGVGHGGHAAPPAITVAFTLGSTPATSTLTIHAPHTEASGLKTARRKPRGFESLPLRRTNRAI